MGPSMFLSASPCGKNSPATEVATTKTCFVVVGWAEGAPSGETQQKNKDEYRRNNMVRGRYFFTISQMVEISNSVGFRRLNPTYKTLGRPPDSKWAATPIDVDVFIHLALR
jgi:hypothetical protein